ncbi:MAG: right-handed parallel beta-helix repeat-containing protein, partial [Thermomicrobiales bacterium]
DSTAYSVTLSNLTLEGTYPTDSYDVLLRSNLQEKTDWTMENCTLKNAYYGMWAPTSHIVMTGGTLESCLIGINAEWEDGETSSSLVMTDVTVTGCDSYGVKFYPWDDSSATFSTVTNCTFHDNPGYGAGLGGDKGSPPTVLITVTDSTFTDNGADSFTGLYLYGGRAEVTRCTITGNTGGGVFIYDSDATITDTDISGNSTPADGAGLDVLAHNRTLSNLTLAGTTLVSNNTAGTVGGGISLNSVSSLQNYAIVGAGTRVTGNNPDQCCDGGAVVDCTTWV